MFQSHATNHICLLSYLDEPSWHQELRHNNEGSRGWECDSKNFRASKFSENCLLDLEIIKFWKSSRLENIDARWFVRDAVLIGTSKARLALPGDCSVVLIVVKQSIYTLGFFRQCLQHRPTDQCLCCCRHCENKSPTLSRNCGQDISNNSVKWRAVVWVRKTPLLLIQRMWRSVPSIVFVRPYARGDFGTCGSR